MELANFLQPFKVNNSEYNYVLLTPPFGKYYIPDDTSTIKSLHSTIKRCIEKNIDFGLCECHDDELEEPLYYDIDLSLKEPVHIDDSLVQNFVKVLNNTISKNLDVSNDNLKAFIMKKENCLEEKSGENYWHIGIHIIYPFIRLNSIGRQIIYDKLIKNIKKENDFKQLPLYEEKLEEIVDHRVIRRNPIIMYGCNKKGKQRYRLEKVYDHNLNTIDNSDFNVDDLMKI